MKFNKKPDNFDQHNQRDTTVNASNNKPKFILRYKPSVIYQEEQESAHQEQGERTELPSKFNRF
jgi:hypothetical protein